MTLISGLPKAFSADVKVDISPVEHCFFGGDLICQLPGARLNKQIETGERMQIDIKTTQTTYELNLPLQGFRDCVKKMHEWGYATD